MSFHQPMRLPHRLLRLCAAGVLLALFQEDLSAVTNPGFEQPVLSPNADPNKDNFVAAVGQDQTLTPVSGWTYAATQTTSYVSFGGVSDLGANNHALEGPLDNNIAWLFINGPRPTAGSGTVSVRQPLGANLLADTRYTLTARVAQSARRGRPGRRRHCLR